MKVGRFDGTNVIEMYRNYVANRNPSQGAGSPGDRADISQNGKNLQSIMAAVRSLPDVRTDLVAGLKQQVAAGTYKVHPVKVADGMLQEHYPLYKQVTGK